jgi:hypothetical protein
MVRSWAILWRWKVGDDNSAQILQRRVVQIAHQGVPHRRQKGGIARFAIGNEPRKNA